MAHLSVVIALLQVGCDSSASLEPDTVTSAAVGAGGATSSAGQGGAASSTSATVGAGAASPCVPTAEVCDGIDNDCNGAVDESDPAFDDACETGLLGACADGHPGCTAGVLACTPPAPATESCNGIDDDCDGSIDEDVPGLGLGCDTGSPGVCGLGTTACSGGRLSCAPSQQPSADVCDLLDNDCDGVTDNGEPCVRRVFVTSMLSDANLGGLAGADARCQLAADGAGLGGNYIAWLSDGSAWAAQRSNHVGAPYVLVDGTVVAADWAELTSGQLQHAIDTTELGGPAPLGPGPTQGVADNTCPPDVALVWTNTGADGTTAPLGYQCFGWSTGQTGIGASYGFASSANSAWTQGCSAIQGACNASAALYCVEQ